MAQIQRVIDDLIPGQVQNGPYRQDVAMSQLSSKNLTQSVPEPMLNIMNKVYSRRLDFERQSQKIAEDRQLFE